MAFWQILDALKRHIALFTAVILLLAVAITAGIQRKEPSYESVAKLMVNTDSLRLSVSRADVRYDTAMAQVVEAVTTQAEILRGDSLIYDLVDKLGEDFFDSGEPAAPRGALSRLPGRIVSDLVHGGRSMMIEAGLLEPISYRAALVQRVRRSLSVYPVRQSQIIEVAFRWPDPDVPPKVLSTLIELYLGKIAALDAQSNSLDLFDRQTGAARERLEQDEVQLAALKTQYGVHDFDLEKRLLIERISRLSVQLEGEGGPVVPPENASSAASAKPGETAAQRTAPAAVDSALVQLRDNLNNLRIARAKMALQFSSGYNHLQELDAQIASAESLLRREADILRDSIASYRKRLQTLDAIEPQINRVQRSIAIDLETYETYRKATQDRRLTEQQATRRMVQVVDPPSTPDQAIGTSRATLLALGLLTAFGLTFIVVIGFDAVAPPRRRSRRAPAAARDLPPISVTRDRTASEIVSPSAPKAADGAHEVTPAE